MPTIRRGEDKNPKNRLLEMLRRMDGERVQSPDPPQAREATEATYGAVC
jgi:hypothetical protein